MVVKNEAKILKEFSTLKKVNPILQGLIGNNIQHFSIPRTLQCVYKRKNPFSPLIRKSVTVEAGFSGNCRIEAKASANGWDQMTEYRYVHFTKFV